MSTDFRMKSKRLAFVVFGYRVVCELTDRREFRTLYCGKVGTDPETV